MVTEKELAISLIQRRSLTPHDNGCFEIIEEFLTNLGFEIHRIKINETENLYAKLNRGGKNLCFLGHTDVVPPGNLALWGGDPFEARIEEGVLIGRGTNDMKGQIAAFLAAIKEFTPTDYSVSILLTSDEEGHGHDGIPKMVTWLQENNETIDLCIIGEPSANTHIGDTVKIGSRGSMNCELVLEGTGGHVAYPQFATNPIDKMCDVLRTLSMIPLDNGNEYFSQSQLVVTSIDVGNATTNLIPSKVSARFNIRFNNYFRGETLETHLRGLLTAYFGNDYQLTCTVTGEAYYCNYKPYKQLFDNAVITVTGKAPEYSTCGATSDGRFMYKLCPCFEIGGYIHEAHKVNEKISLDDRMKTKEIYVNILKGFSNNTD